MSIEEDRARWERAAHAVQTGVKWEQETGDAGDSPKHLRTGVNIAMCDLGGLSRLLIEKGVITEAEYVKAIADELEAEVARYEERIRSRFGQTIRLG